MGQKQKKFTPEEKSEKPVKAEPETSKTKSDELGTTQPALEQSQAKKEAPLKAILLNVESSQEDWPREALRAILIRFKRMPRYGWTLSHVTFCDKFSVQVSLLTNKKQAQSVLKNKKGNHCTNRQFKEESAKRHKLTDLVVEEQTLKENKYNNRVKTLLLECYEETKKTDIVQVQRTPKCQTKKSMVLHFKQSTKLSTNLYAKKTQLT